MVAAARAGVDLQLSARDPGNDPDALGVSSSAEGVVWSLPYLSAIQAQITAMFDPRIETLLKALASLSLAGVTGLFLRQGVNQLWLILPIALTLIVGLLLYGYSERRAHLVTQSHLALLFDELDLPRSTHARATYHEVRRDYRNLWRKKCWYQVINYQPDNARGRGRRWPIDWGLLGRVYRDGTELTFNAKTQVEWSEKMAHEYNFSAVEIRALTQNRFSNMAFPVLKQMNEVVGVIWFDASEPDIFPVMSDRKGQALIKVTADRISEALT